MELAICSYCDAVHRRVAVPGRATARCVACDAPLYRANKDVAAMLAITLTAAAGFAVANLFPLLTLTLSGQQTRATLVAAILAAWDRNLPFVGVALAIALIVLPLVELGLLLWILVPLVLRTRPPGFRSVMRFMTALRPWRMLEVFMLGIVITIVKLAGMATAVLGWGAFGVIVMVFAMGSLGTFDHATLWDRVAQVKR
jgi:paraquat-inducible protein A